MGFKFNEIPRNVNSFAMKCKRVWNVLRKPTKKELEQVVKISALGVLILGFLGFLISIIMKLFI